MHTECLMLDVKVLYYYYPTSVGLTAIHHAEWTALKEGRVHGCRTWDFICALAAFLTLCNTIPVRNY